jgi:TPR repeat protein
MEQGFIDILKKVVTQHGKEYLLEAKKCKAIVSDYTGSDYRIERGMLLRAVEAGVSNAIFSAEKTDLESCMKVQQRNLQEEQYMDSAIAGNVVNVLAHVLRDVAIKEVQADGKNSNKDFDEAVGFYDDDQYDKALPIFTALAKENHAGAQTYMGEACFTGNGITQDYAKAVEWFRKAADQGHAPAQNNLGFCYGSGNGVTQDKAKAVEWFRKAADQGHAPAQNNLGYAYQYGNGVTQDYAKAIEWYRKAVTQGDDTAQNNLGLCYHKGEGVTQDYAQAVEWYRKAAEQGHKNAQSNLGFCYENGKGVTQDKAKAIEWYRKAAAQGNEGAKKKLAELNA